MVVDDQARLRSLAWEVIDATPGFVTIAEVASGAEAVALAAVLRPDVVLMDVRLPGLSGFDAARLIVQAGTARLLVLLSSDYFSVPADLVRRADLVGIPKEKLRPSILRGLWAALGQPAESGTETAARRAEASSTMASP